MRRRSLAATLAALAGILFLQAAVAFAPCELPGRSAAMAAAVAMAGMPDCPEAGTAGFGLAHCASEAPAMVNASFELPDIALPAAAPVPAPRATAFMPADRAVALVAVPGPPPRILFQSFLL